MTRVFLTCCAAAAILSCGSGSNPGATIDVGNGSQDGRSLSLVTAQAANPAPVPLTIKNTGNCQMHFDIAAVTAAGGNWLSVSNASDDVDPTGQKSLNVLADVITPDLQPSVYTGTLTVTAFCKANNRAAANSPFSIAVNLTVRPATSTLGSDTGYVGFGGAALKNEWVTASVSQAPPGPPVGFTSRLVEAAGYVLVYQGANPSPVLRRYDPFADLWLDDVNVTLPAYTGAPALVSTGSKAVFFGPVSATGSFLTLYDASNNTAVGAGVAGAPAFAGYLAVGHGILLMNDENGPASLLDFSTPGVSATTIIPGPCPACVGRLVWTGREVLSYVDGQLYALDPWAQHPAWSARAAPPAARQGTSVVWTGSELIVFGGRDSVNVRHGDGFRYSPARDRWTPLTNSPLSGRINANAFWSGAQLIVFGGVDDHGDTTDGARWDPLLPGGWLTLSSNGAPPSSAFFSLWTSAGAFFWSPYGPTAYLYR